MSKVILSNKRSRHNLLESLDYDVKYFNVDGKERIERIRIPKQRILLLDEIGIENCFNDDSEIYEQCELCLKDKSKRKCHNYRQIQGVCRHIISSEHKDDFSITEIKDALRIIETKSILNQLHQRGIV